MAKKSTDKIVNPHTKITPNEAKALLGILNSNFQSELPENRVGEQVWSWSCNTFDDPKMFSGAVASLLKKGLIGRHKQGKDESTLWLLDEGLAEALRLQGEAEPVVTKKVKKFRKVADPMTTIQVDARPVEAIVAEIADKNGLHEKDVIRFPDLLVPYGLALEAVTPEMIQEAKKINQFKVEKAERIIDAHNAKLRPPVAHPVTELHPDPPTPVWLLPAAPKGVKAQKPVKKSPETTPVAPKIVKPGRVLAFGKYPATAVLRWMGEHGWSVEEAQRGMEGLKLEVSLSTIQIQVKAGSKKDGSRGEPAPLLDKEEKFVKKLRKGK